MPWVATIEATYADVADAKNALEAMRPDAFDSLARKGKKIIARYVYGDQSKYSAVRPAAAAIHELFDPVADDDYYRAWPIAVTIQSTYDRRVRPTPQAS